MAGQADDVLRQLAKLLAAGGSSIARVLQVTIFATDLSEKPDFNRIWKTHFTEVRLPARAMIGVADLGTGVKLSSSRPRQWMGRRQFRGILVRPLSPGRTCGTECVERASRVRKWPRLRTGQ